MIMIRKLLVKFLSVFSALHFFCLHSILSSLNTFSFYSNTAYFESQSLGTSILRLRNLVTGRFLAINSNGRAVTQVGMSFFYLILKLLVEFHRGGMGSEI